MKATVVDWPDGKRWGWLQTDDGRTVLAHSCVMAQAGLGIPRLGEQFEVTVLERRGGPQVCRVEKVK